MKHRIEDSVDVNVNVNVPADDISDLIDKITESAITIITVVTTAAIIKSYLQKY